MIRAGLAALCLAAAPAWADAHLSFLGGTASTANDSIGQFEDRWQSSVVEGNLFFGPEGRSPTDAGLGEVYEVRLRSQIITPENLAAPQPGDRPFAGVLSIGLLTHGNAGAYEVTLGGELAAVGPQTGSFRFQDWLHEKLGFVRPNTEGNEIGNGVHGGVFAEVGRSFGTSMRLRPFAEIRAGIETLARVGIDVTWGGLGRDDLMIREQVTGQRLPGLRGAGADGLSFVAGADVAWVAESIYLPKSRGLDPLPRARLRAGANWMGERLSLFYGLTYLSPEFDGQREGQLLGIVQARYRF